MSHQLHPEIIAFWKDMSYNARPHIYVPPLIENRDEVDWDAVLFCLPPGGTKKITYYRIATTYKDERPPKYRLRIDSTIVGPYEEDEALRMIRLKAFW